MSMGKPVPAKQYDGPILEAAQTVEQPPPPTPPPDPKQPGDWMPLGVFALAQEERGDPVMFFQLSVNRDGVISGAFQSTLTNDSKQVAGKVDKATQRAAWRVGDNGKTLYETSLANLTQDVSPVVDSFRRQPHANLAAGSHASTSTGWPGAKISRNSQSPRRSRTAKSS